ncbi:hypothetical protein FIU28_17460 [Tardiphaga sp. vice154]|uniref:hypothetical protein n=1 Tax=Tardiphaga sp. vice154 TaxID=2592814 RepID=UPI0011631436|nr:hypothetical protein [Tardiphaga sp. vice154]QDM22740.1 hypothetical protein FIU28_17460 [Tardiphaga sp. vice154]
MPDRVKVIPGFLGGATAAWLADDLIAADAALRDRLEDAKEIVPCIQDWLERRYSRTHPAQLGLELCD